MKKQVRYLFLPILLSMTLLLGSCGINARSMRGITAYESRTYTQNHFGYAAGFGEEWTFAESKTLEELNASAGSAQAASAKSAGNYYVDFMADNSSTGSTIVIRNLQMGPLDFIRSEEEIFNQIADLLYAEAENEGLTDPEKISMDVNFLGAARTIRGVEGTYALSDQFSTKMQQVVVPVRCGIYLSLIFISCVPDNGTDSIQSILDMFQKA